MSSAKPILVVLGATGNQGGSVIAHFLSLSSSPYALRAVTRDTSSAKAKLLASQGVEVVAANFDDPQSLDAAFSGASIIFSVTDFLQSMLNPSLREKAAAAGISTGFYIRDYEAQQNRNIIDAAAKLSTLERFIYSSLPYANKLSDGKYEHVYYYDSKAAAEEYGRATYPELWEKTSVFYAGFYLENYVWEAKALFAPKLNKERDILISWTMEPLTTSLFPWYSVKLIAVNEWLSMEDVSKLLAQSLQKGIDFTGSTPDFSQDIPDFQQGRQEMIAFSIEFGYDGGKVDKSVVKPGDLGVPVQLKSVKEWIEKQDWEEILSTE
ncbi:NmrA-like family domain-containing protein 1 [Talaromyces pinophilus]|nr:NmrA-like family domain-containing protein 1 [Talaromyces pinophilus]